MTIIIIIITTAKPVVRQTGEYRTTSNPYKYYVKDFFVRYGTPPKRLDVHQRAIHHSKAN